jgi:hypothetical protein
MVLVAINAVNPRNQQRMSGTTYSFATSCTLSHFTRHEVEIYAKSKIADTTAEQNTHIMAGGFESARHRTRSAVLDARTQTTPLVHVEGLEANATIALIVRFEPAPIRSRGNRNLPR